MTQLVVRARFVLASSSRWLVDGGFVVREGRVQRLLASHAAVRRAARTARLLDCGEHLLTPGLVNAHAHLELSGLAGRLPRGADFAAWVRSLVALRARRSPARLALDARAGAERALASGTTSLVDIDSSGATLRGLARHPLRVWLCREALDAHDPERTRAALARLRRPLPSRARLREGLSPHAPFSVSRALFAELGSLARARSLPVTMHWSETRAELEWLRAGTGPLAALLGASPHCSGLDLLAQAGLLRAPLSLVHGNFPAPGEARRIARARAVVVHCPGSHAWFEREPFPWRTWQRAGVTLALGTDSLASNTDLDMGREMRLARESAPQLQPASVWDMATSAAAQSVGARGEIGELVPGAWADWCAWSADGRRLDEALDELTRGAAALAGVWVAGRRARGAEPAGAGARECVSHASRRGSSRAHGAPRR